MGFIKFPVQFLKLSERFQKLSERFQKLSERFQKLSEGFLKLSEEFQKWPKPVQRIFHHLVIPTKEESPLYGATCRDSSFVGMTSLWIWIGF